MRTSIVPLLAAGTLLLGGCGEKAAKRDKPTFMFACFRPEIVSSDYTIPEMDTPEEAAFIQDRMRVLPGYVDSTYNLPSRTLTISYRSSQIRKMNFEEAIALSGFAVNNRPINTRPQLIEALQ